jgi:hypothetical protein
MYPCTPRGTPCLLECSVENDMHHATIYKGIGRNSFAVQVGECHGIIQIQCDKITADVDNKEFGELVRSISPVRQDSLVHVSISLGEYCLRQRAFTRCELIYPSLPTTNQSPAWYPTIQPIVSELAKKQQPVAQKRKRFITTSQTRV